MARSISSLISSALLAFSSRKGEVMKWLVGVASPPPQILLVIAVHSDGAAVAGELDAYRGVGGLGERQIEVGGNWQGGFLTWW